MGNWHRARRDMAPDRGPKLLDFSTFIMVSAELPFRIRSGQSRQGDGRLG
jgi:hypothetical protein